MLDLSVAAVAAIRLGVFLCAPLEDRCVPATIISNALTELLCAVTDGPDLKHTH